MSKVEAVSRERAIKILAMGLPEWPQVTRSPLRAALPSKLAGWSWMYRAHPDHDDYVVQRDGHHSDQGAITESDYQQARRDAGLTDPLLTGGDTTNARRAPGYNEALAIIAREWSEWPDARGLVRVESGTLPGWFWHDSRRTGMHLKRPGQGLIITRRHWKDARDKYIAKLGAHAVLADNPARPLADLLVDTLTEWPDAGSDITPPLPEGVFWCRLSDGHAWYAYMQHGGAQCHWPEWYSAARAKGMHVKAPTSEFERLTQTPPPAPLDNFVSAASDPGHDYHTLASVLVRAFDQASAGKGKDRHAQALPFDDQPMQTISQLIGSHDGLAYQAVKKIQESQRLEHDHAVAELLGAIIYTAGNIIHRENSNNG